MELSHLTDQILLNDIKKFVHRERESITPILYHLREIERRKLYSDLRYSSLFKYCVEELKYSDSSAQRRIVAARLIEEIPEIETQLENGTLSLTNISIMNQHYKEAGPEAKKQVLEKIQGLTKRECEKKLFEMTGKVEPSNEGRRRLSKDKVQVNLVITNETFELLEKVRAMMGVDLSSDELIRNLSTLAIEKIEKEKFKQTSGRGSLSPAKVGRAVPAAVKREVYKRDLVCANCGGVHQLNYDHRQPYAYGGTSGIENIRLLCFNCNQRSRMRMKL